MQTARNMLNSSHTRVLATFAASTAVVATGFVTIAQFAGMSVASASPSTALSVGIATISNPVVSTPLFGTIAACCLIGAGIFIVDKLLYEKPVTETLSGQAFAEQRKKLTTLRQQVQTEKANHPPAQGEPGHVTAYRGGLDTLLQDIQQQLTDLVQQEKKGPQSKEEIDTSNTKIKNKTQMFSSLQKTFNQNVQQQAQPAPAQLQPPQGQPQHQGVPAQQRQQPVPVSQQQPAQVQPQLQAMPVQQGQQQVPAQQQMMTLLQQMQQTQVQMQQYFQSLQQRQAATVLHPPSSFTNLRTAQL